MMGVGQTVTGMSPFPAYLHLAAFFLFGLTGGLAAVKRHYDFIGLFVMCFATAAGGGLIRDGLFIQRGPPLITEKSSYIAVIGVSAVAAMLFRHRILRFGKLIAWIDALCIGAYGVIGVQKSISEGLSGAASIIVGVVTAAGGGLLRDILARDEPLMLKPGQFYVLAILLGCCVYYGGIHFAGTRPFAAYAAISVTFITRILAIQFNWATLPVSRWNKADDPENSSE